jgi:hypothetical protein
LTPSGGTAAKTTLTIATGVSSAAAVMKVTQGIGGGWMMGAIAGLVLAAWGWLTIRQRRRLNRFYGFFAMVLAVAVLAVVSGCGGDSGGGGNITPKGVSTVTVTATSGSTTQTSSLQLTVN